MDIDLDFLGITKEELIEKIVSKAAIEFSGTKYYDEEDDEYYYYNNKIAKELNKVIEERIKKSVTKFCDKFIKPSIEKKIDETILEKTNQWGEKKGEKIGFKEYIIARAEKYLDERVDDQGRDSRDSYNTRGTSRRIVYMVEDKLTTQIEEALKDGVKLINQSFKDGISATVKDKMEELTKDIQIKFN